MGLEQGPERGEGLGELGGREEVLGLAVLVLLVGLSGDLVSRGWGGEDLNIGKNIPRVYFEDIILVHKCIV